MRKGRSRKLRAALILTAGAVFALVTLEAALTAHSLVRPATALKQGPGAFTVLCVGNSITKGDGAPPGQSYPELLEKLLREKHPELGAKVVNAGVSNATTTLLLQRLPDQLRDLRPDVVTFMAGDPNYWFNYGRNLFRQKQNPGSSWAKLRWKLDKFLGSFRSVNFLRLLISGSGTPAVQLSPLQWLGLAESFNYSPELLSSGQAAKAYRSLKEHFRANPGEVEVAISLARLSFLLHKPEELRKWIEVAQKLAPDRFLLDLYWTFDRRWPSLDAESKERYQAARELVGKNYPGGSLYGRLIAFHYRNHTFSYPERPAGVAKKDFCGYIARLQAFRPMDVTRHRILGRCLVESGKPEEAVDVIFAALERNPFSFRDQLMLRDLGKIERTASPALREKIRARRAARAATFQAQPRSGGGDLRDETNRWVRSDFAEMVALARSSGAKVMIQAYPPLRTKGMRAIDWLVPGIAQELGVPFSDTQLAIRSLRQNEAEWQTNYTDMFGPEDHHMSGSGNAMVAKKLLESLEEQGWLRAR